MRYITPLAILFAVLLTLLSPALAIAQNEGQAELDRATQTKITATSFSELSVVIDLLDEAIGKGLDEGNTQFANRLLASTLFDRANLLSTVIFSPGQNDPQVIGMIGIAVSDLKRSISIDPEQVEAQYQLARLYVATGQNREEAIAALTKVIETKDAEASMRAKAYSLRAPLHRDDREKTLADFGEAIKLAPDDVELLRTRGVYYLLEEEADNALADLDKAIELEPDYAPAYEARGLALTLKEEYEAAVEAFDEALKRDADMTSAYSNRARAFALADNTEKALEDLDKALEKNPESISVLMLRAQIKYSAGRPEAALEDIDRVLSIQPGVVQALRLRAELLVATDRVSDAIKTMEDLVQALPDQPELMLQLGVYYMSDKQPRKAIAVFDKILEIDPTIWQALRNRGDANLSIAAHAEAIADYEKAIKIETESPGLLNNLAWVLATSPDDKLRDGKKALELATKASELTDHKAGYILSTLAAAYAEMGDFESAREWSAKAVEAGEEDEKEQLRKELESYRASKPWRELQNVEEEAAVSEEPVEPAPAQTFDF